MRPLLILLLFAMIGAVTASAGKIALLVGLGAFAIGMYKTVRTRNREGTAHLYAGFIVGAEVYFRMTFCGLPWEFGKIAVMILLLTGMLVERQRRPMPVVFLMYALLLLPGVFVPHWTDMAAFKKEFMFTFFGQVVLVIAAFYFYKRKLDIEQLFRFMRWIMLGVVMTSVLVFLKTPDYTSIHFGSGSNFASSGGFGPNQVAAVLGLGVVLMAIALLLRRPLFVYRFLDMLILFALTVQGFFTFSRGGLMSAGLALLFAVVAAYAASPRKAMLLLKITPMKLVLLSVLIIIAFVQTNNVTGGALGKRYFNVDEYGHRIKQDYSTKRLDIVSDDIKTFKRNILTGVGIGGGRAYREAETGISAAHVEFSRMLAEHGILGLLALVLMFAFPAYLFFTTKHVLNRFLLVAFTGYGLLTMSHNALRLALPSFLYGMGFIVILVQQQISVPRISGAKP